MMNIKKVFAAGFAVCNIFCAISASADFSVYMNNVVSEGAYEMNFDGESDPVVIDGITMIPIRVLANSLNMQVDWDAETSTAVLSIPSGAGDTPISKFITELINKSGGYGGLDLSPKCLQITLSEGSGTSMLRLVFADSEGDEVCIGKQMELEKEPYMNENACLMVPLRDVVSIMCMQVSWNGEEGFIEIKLPDSVVVPKGIRIVPSYKFGVRENEISAYVPEQITYEEPATAAQEETLGTYIGNFKITHYCPCSICNGGYSGTAWAGKIIPGQTIAVDPNVIPKLSWVYIDGYGLRRAEDCGGAIKGNHIDLAVQNHAEAYKYGVVYKDVWLLN